MTAGAENRVDYAAEFSQLKIENDLVNVFFDEIHRMSDAFTFNFVESLKQDVSITTHLTLQSDPILLLIDRANRHDVVPVEH